MNENFTNCPNELNENGEDALNGDWMQHKEDYSKTL